MDLGEGERELEMRVVGAEDPGRAADLERAVRALDPDARIRVDHATGIVHAITRFDALEVTDAITRAGFEASAMTG